MQLIHCQAPRRLLSARLVRRLATEAGASASSSSSSSSRKLSLSFVSPYQVRRRLDSTQTAPQTIMKDAMVEQVNLKTTDGDLGVLGGHVPSILQLQPGLVEIFDGPAAAPATTKSSFFVSGGFAIVNPDSSMEISAMEAVPVDHIDPRLVADGLAEAGRRLAAISSASSELEKAEIHIHNDVYQALSKAASKN